MRKKHSLPVLLLVGILAVLMPNPQAHATTTHVPVAPQGQAPIILSVYRYITPYGYARGWCGRLGGYLNYNSSGNLDWYGQTASLLDVGQGCTNPITAYPGDALFTAQAQHLDTHNPFYPFDDEWVVACSSFSASPGTIDVMTHSTGGSCTTPRRGSFRYRLVAWWKSDNDNVGWKGVEAYSPEFVVQ